MVLLLFSLLCVWLQLLSCFECVVPPTEVRLGVHWLLLFCDIICVLRDTRSDVGGFPHYNFSLIRSGDRVWTTLIQASSRRRQTFLSLGELSIGITYICGGKTLWSVMCLATGDSLFCVAMLRLCSVMRSFSVWPVSLIYCLEHKGQVITYTTLIVLQVLFPNILCFFLVVVDMMVVVVMMFSHVLHASLIQRWLPLL